jgi:hypothetical protein
MDEVINEEIDEVDVPVRKHFPSDSDIQVPVHPPNAFARTAPKQGQSALAAIYVNLI